MQVFTATDKANPNVEFIGLRHPMFSCRDSATIYPDCQRDPEYFLQFHALWCRCLAELLRRSSITLFHCLDYHSALTPWYYEEVRGPGEPPLRVVLTVHNALYQGSMLQTLSDSEWRRIAAVTGLPHVRQIVEVEGDFNMLQAVLQYIQQFQGGVGVSTVSKGYAAQMPTAFPLFRRVRVTGHPNPMPESRRPLLPDKPLLDHKRRCKAEVQCALGLQEDPEARLLVFVGRWTYEKGIDLVARLALWFLRSDPRVQLFIVGPVGDAFGEWAASRLKLAARQDEFRKRLFVRPDFFQVQMLVLC